jgi:inhibitor of KinA
MYDINMTGGDLQMKPLGDQAALVYCTSESAAGRFAAAVRAASFAWLLDVVQAYTSVGVFFDLDEVDYRRVNAELQRLSWGDANVESKSVVHVVPCCYEFGLDLERVARHTGLTRDAVIEAHRTTTYTIYAIGFCPGFPYLGYLPEPLCGVPRLDTPRLKVEAGSVGLTGRQTGIYTEARPGGWNIIGRTPLELVNVADGYFPLETGDRVRFQRIDEGEFARMCGLRLDNSAGDPPRRPVSTQPTVQS